MKRILTCAILFASSFLIASAADAPSITGKWQVHISIAGNESDISCALTQKDADLSGSCTTEQGPVTLSGKVDGTKVNWTYKSEYNGGPITLTYKGTSESADKITGSVVVEEYSAEGDFTATQTK